MRRQRQKIQVLIIWANNFQHGPMILNCQFPARGRRVKYKHDSFQSKSLKELMPFLPEDWISARKGHQKN
jgi:hypothetical protein